LQCTINSRNPNERKGPGKFYINNNVDEQSDSVYDDEDDLSLLRLSDEDDLSLIRPRFSVINTGKENFML